MSLKKYAWNILWKTRLLKSYDHYHHGPSDVSGNSIHHSSHSNMLIFYHIHYTRELNRWIFTVIVVRRLWSHFWQECEILLVSRESNPKVEKYLKDGAIKFLQADLQDAKFLLEYNPILVMATTDDQH